MYSKIADMFSSTPDRADEYLHKLAPNVRNACGFMRSDAILHIHNIITAKLLNFLEADDTLKELVYIMDRDDHPSVKSSTALAMGDLVIGYRVYPTTLNIAITTLLKHANEEMQDVASTAASALAQIVTSSKLFENKRQETLTTLQKFSEDHYISAAVRELSELMGVGTVAPVANPRTSSALASIQEDNDVYPYTSPRITASNVVNLARPWQTAAKDKDGSPEEKSVKILTVRY